MTPETPTGSLNALAFSATVHCLTSCAIGEVLGPANRWMIARGKGHAVVHRHRAH